MRLILALLAAALPAFTQHSISLLALDRQSQPLPDLQASDLRLFDNGHPRPIVSLARVEQASSIVILYDLLNTAIAERGDSSPQIAAALQTVPPLAPIYMYVLSGDAALVAVHGFDASATPAWPRDAASLIQSVLRGLHVSRGNQYAAIGARVSAARASCGSAGEYLSR